MTLSDLANSRSIVYVVTRLFDYTEKIKAESVEKAVLNGLVRAMQEKGIERSTSEAITFVPFRDTAQDKMKAVNKTKTIYDEDLKRLRNLFMMVGFLDGLSKDEGVCMEIGYAYGVGVPILLVLTDFIRREFKEIPSSEHLLDPVLLAMVSKLIYQYKIPETQTTFLNRLIEGLENVYKKVDDTVYQIAMSPDLFQHAVIPRLPPPEVYIDFGGGHYEWERLLQERLLQTLSLRGISSQISQRYAWSAGKSAAFHSAPFISDLGLKDITHAANAKVIITCGDADEMSSGTAAIQGFARSLNKKVLLYDSKLTYLVGDDEHRMSRNLMIDYSADKIVRHFDDLPEAVEVLLRN